MPANFPTPERIKLGTIPKVIGLKVCVWGWGGGGGGVTVYVGGG